MFLYIYIFFFLTGISVIYNQCISKHLKTYLLKQLQAKNTTEAPRQ